MISIERLTKATAEAAADLSRLGTELHGEDRRMDVEALNVLVNDPDVSLIVARDGQRIVGMGAVYLIRKIGNNKCYMEDLIVDKNLRGGGIGGKLMDALIDDAKQRGARSLEFMTGTHREGAHRFYERLGFSKKDRFVYKMPL